MKVKCDGKIIELDSPMAIERVETNRIEFMDSNGFEMTLEDAITLLLHREQMVVILKEGQEIMHSLMPMFFEDLDYSSYESFIKHPNAAAAFMMFTAVGAAIIRHNPVVLTRLEGNLDGISQEEIEKKLEIVRFFLTGILPRMDVVTKWKKLLSGLDNSFANTTLTYIIDHEQDPNSW